MAWILVIEDDDHVRGMLRQMLRGEGYEVMEAAEGGAGLKLYREKPADLVITDIVMPGKEGLETIMELRRSYPRVKIIAISGGGRLGPRDYLQTAKLLGAHRIFFKPFEMKELLQAVQELLGPEKINP